MKRLFSRAAMMLLIMVVTTTTAWAIKTETPVTYTVTYSSNTITIRNGGTTTASWMAQSSGMSHFWEVNDSHNLSNGMTIKPSADVSVIGGSPLTKTSTTFTFTAPSNTAITGVTFKNGNNDVAATSTSSEPGTTFTVTLAASKVFTGFTVTYGYISGSCGASATWSLAKENGQYTTLTIGGSGAMSNYSAGATPWGTDVTTATIGSDITGIGNNAFNGCTALTRVDVQKTDGLVTLGSGALSGCNALAAIVAPTPALALQYKSATGWSAYAEKMSANFGGYAFRIDGNTEANAAYAVADADDLSHLAAAVNAGNDASGLTFRQTTDITFTGGSETESNYTAIGNRDCNFSGTFDGQNHVVRGIRIYKDGNKAADDLQAIFGSIGSGATVKNIILADAHITGRDFIGGIAGYNNDGTIENCHVLSNVTIHAVQSEAEKHGGIVGYNYNGTVTGCTSAAAITTAAGIDKCYRYGGIAGEIYYGTVKDCIYLGTSLGGTAGVGAIVGDNSSTVKNCYFTDTDIRGKNKDGNALAYANSAVGTGSSTNCGPALRDAADNSGFLALMAARNDALTKVTRTPALSTAADITLQGRTLYKDGKWNTLCLPFDVTLSGSVLDGAIVKKLDATTSNLSNDGTLTLNFESETTTMTAGTPYLIRWTSGDNLVNPVFTDVTIDASASTTVNFNGGAFRGTYSPINFEANDKSILFLGGENKLYWPNADMALRSCRAYFDLGTNEARKCVLNFDDDEDNTTGIAPLLSPEGDDAGASPRGGLVGASWYDLQGRRLSQKPTKAGLYIYKGKKLYVK